VPGSDQQIAIGISVREQHQMRLRRSGKLRHLQRGEAPNLLTITLDILLARPIRGVRLQSLVAFMVNLDDRLASVSGQQREFVPWLQSWESTSDPCPAAWMRILSVNQ
jgi:hypothetical protein